MHKESILSNISYSSNAISLNRLQTLEIKPCGLGSRIRDLEAFWYKTEIKIIYFVPLCLIVLIVSDCMVYPDPKKVVKVELKFECPIWNSNLERTLTYIMLTVYHFCKAQCDNISLYILCPQSTLYDISPFLSFCCWVLESPRAILVDKELFI